jgi:UDP-N-acetylmuramoylalanine--D-glutamate ligase
MNLRGSLKHKNIGIFGLGKSGLSCFKSINSIVPKIFCYDDSEKSRENFEFKDFLLEPRLWTDMDYVILSPGISNNHYIFGLENLSDAKFICDVELFYLLNRNKKYIAVTGTNGKSTTVSLIHHVLTSLGMNYGLCGNIGIPIMDLMNKDYDGYVVELSSFQLDLLDKFSSEVSILLNISPDHLDRYKTMDNYVNSKLRVFKNSRNRILGVDDDYTKEIYKKNKKKYEIIPISSSFKLKYGISIINNLISVNIPLKKLNSDGRRGVVIKKELPMIENPYVKGFHNNQNFASCYCVAFILLAGYLK